MSASLVGSEMCIRDRLRCAVYGHRNPALHNPANQCRAALCQASEPWPGSVSYTHLTLPTICSV
eukprot:1663102-Alexandrium_andersonii.AAC.1